MIQPIVLYSKKAHSLTNPTNPVDIENEKEEASSVTVDLLETLETVGGLGLAANQLGVTKSVCVVTLNAEEKPENRKVIPMVNPEITWHGEEQEDSVEGCLSLPDIVLTVKRYKDIKVKYIDPRTWEENEIEVSFPNSVVIQHEVDHLNGKLIIDDISQWDRNRIKTKLKRIARGTLPINYVGMTYSKQAKSWIAVGSNRALEHLQRYRMMKMLEALKANKEAQELDNDEETIETEKNETGEFYQHEVEQDTK